MDGGRFISHVKPSMVDMINALEKKIGIDVKYFLKNTPSLLTVTIISTIFGLISSIIMARLLSKDIYGTYLYVLTLINTLSIFSISGMSTAVQRDASRGFDGILVAGSKIRFKWSFLGSLVLIGAGIYYLTQGNLLLSKCLFLSALFFPFVYSFDTFFNFVMGKMLFNKYALYKTIIITINATSVVALVLATENIFWALLAYFISFSVLQLILWKKTVQKDKTNDCVDNESIKYGKVLTLQGTIPMVANQFDNIVIANSLGMGDLAVFTIALYVGSFANVPLDIISNLIFPKVAKKDKKEGTIAVLKNLKYIIMLSIIICGFFAILVPFLIPLFYSASYHDSIFYAQLILVAQVAFAPGAILNQMLKAQARSREMLRILLITRILEIVLFAVMIPLLGLLGAVIVRIINNLGFSLITYILIKRG
ncbi:MAG: membrane protein involved in the export of O-antigen and teichoic acid [Methanobacterium sp. Maddingley MBC34]|nr:MAG: membrane protein involved in the export of O-antigen and teichoic acid [Methanobacterium sp. Maddingley MBC34]